MPIFYPTGIVEEHLATRKGAGLFDVSHMGRFIVSGKGALGFLQHVLSNNAEALDIRVAGAQYTIIPTETGGAVDDAYLYRFVEEEYLLVVNAANLEKDWNHFQDLLKGFDDVELVDSSEEIAMISLQGPRSREILERDDSLRSAPRANEKCREYCKHIGCPGQVCAYRIYRRAALF